MRKLSTFGHCNRVCVAIALALGLSAALQVVIVFTSVVDERRHLAFKYYRNSSIDCIWSMSHLKLSEQCNIHPSDTDAFGRKLSPIIDTTSEPPGWAMWHVDSMRRQFVPGEIVTIERAYGFPFRWMSWHEWGDFRSDKTVLIGGWRAGDRNARTIPLRFHAIPFIINSAVTAVFLCSLSFCVIATHRGIIRSIRKCRVRCVKCAYNLSGTPRGHPCSECGYQEADQD